MNLYKQFLTLSRIKQIALIVFFIHFGLVFTLICHDFFTRQLKPTRGIIVKTHRLQPPLKIAESIPSHKKQQPTVTVAPKTQSAAPKPKHQTHGKKSAPAAAKKPTIAKEVEKEDFLLKEIAHSLQTLGKETKQPKTELTLPSKIVSRAEPIVETSNSYGQFLISYLQNALDLPEFGDVKVKLEIDRFGKLIDCEILEAKSRKNGEFLKNRLPELTFPCLNDFDITDATHTFTITFRNVEIH